MTELKPCPFCGGRAIKNWTKTPVRDVGQSWVGGEATATVACSKCGARGKQVAVDCGSRDATDADVDTVLLEAVAAWNQRPTSQDIPDDTRHAVRAMVKAFQELNAIRARDGVPYSRDGSRYGVCENYFSSVIEELDASVRELTGKSAHCHPELYIES